jgi:hypothetical protein
MLYLRSLIYIYLGKCDDELHDIIKAISMSQEIVDKYFYIGFCIERPKLFFASWQPAKGLEDIKKIKEISP